MSESREKSEQLRAEFESVADGLLILTRNLSDYRDRNTREAWYWFQFGERLGREASRRDALEEQWISVESGTPKVGKRVFVSVLGEGFKVRTTGLWTGSQWRLGSIEQAPDEKFIGPIVGRVDYWRELPEIPKAAAIRALEEKGPDTYSKEK